jgi:DNA-binding transcriptional regulator YiaG
MTICPKGGGEMNTYKPHEFADMLGVTVKTLQCWDVSGKLN